MPVLFFWQTGGSWSNTFLSFLFTFVNHFLSIWGSWIILELGRSSSARLPNNSCHWLWSGGDVWLLRRLGCSEEWTCRILMNLIYRIISRILQHVMDSRRSDSHRSGVWLSVPLGEAVQRSEVAPSTISGGTFARFCFMIILLRKITYISRLHHLQKVCTHTYVRCFLVLISFSDREQPAADWRFFPTQATGRSGSRNSNVGWNKPNLLRFSS